MLKQIKNTWIYMTKEFLQILGGYCNYRACHNSIGVHYSSLYHF